MSRQQGPPATEVAGAIGKIMLLVLFLGIWLLICGVVIYAVGGAKGLLIVLAVSVFIVLAIFSAARQSPH